MRHKEITEFCKGGFTVTTYHHPVITCDHCGDKEELGVEIHNGEDEFFLCDTCCMDFDIQPERSREG